MNGKVIVTGNGWLGGGFESIGSVFRAALSEAETEVMIGTYSMSGATGYVYECIEETLKRNVRVVLFINRFNSQDKSAKERIMNLKYSYMNFEVYSFESENNIEDFHAKVTVVDRKRAIIGSSNISRRGFTTNHEIAVYVEGKIADEAARALEKLIINGSMSHI